MDISFLFQKGIVAFVVILVTVLNVGDIVFKGKIRKFFTAPVLVIIYLICAIYLISYLIMLRQM